MVKIPTETCLKQLRKRKIIYCENIVKNISLTDKDKNHYDLIVIGGGSGGLSCAKQGKNI